MRISAKHLIASSALALLGTAALAQSGGMSVYQPDLTQDVSADDVIGMRMYATKDAIDTTRRVGSQDMAGYDDIGEIEDLILDRTGQVKAMVVGVGGFLGMGDKEIAVPTEAVNFVPRDGGDANFVLVTNADKASIEALPAFDEDTMMNARQSQTAAEQSVLTRPAMRASGYTDAAIRDLTTDQLVGASVYDTQEDDIGDVDELVLGSDGTSVEKVVIDVGGFLGIDTHEVALSLDEVQIMKANDGARLRLYVDATKAQLEALPSYEGN